MLTCLYILITKALSVLLITVAVGTFTSLLLFITHISSSCLHLSFLKLSILSLMLTQWILSCAGNQDLLGSECSHLLSSLMRYLAVLFMPRLVPFFL